MKKRLGFLRSGSGLDSASRSIVSRVRKRGFSEDSTALATAFWVMEFLEKSPINREMSAALMTFERLSALAKEPVGVDSRKVKFPRVLGRIFWSASGRIVIISAFAGNLSDLQKSEIWLSVRKDWLLPPIILIIPCLVSGIFQIKSAIFGGHFSSFLK